MNPRPNSDSSFPREEQRVTFQGISHLLNGGGIAETILENAEKYDLIVLEGSVYLGGFIPAEAPMDKIRVTLFPPSALLSLARVADPAALYAGGRAIPDSARGHRRLFESMAAELHKGLRQDELLRLVSDLLYLRNKYSNVIVYNEPDLWLRTVWYEADLLFQYLLYKRDFRLFGAFIYSEMDAAFGSYLRRNGGAINAMTADDVLLFAFDGDGGPDSQLGSGSQYVAYRAILETPGRLAEAMTPAQLDEMREQEARMLSPVVGVNRSLLFGRRLGVAASQTPCLVLWTSLDDRRVVVLQLANYNDDEKRSMMFKELANIVAGAVSQRDNDVLDAITKALAGLTVQTTYHPVGSVVRSFLAENTPPSRDRLTIDDIDNFYSVRSVTFADVARFLGPNGYLDLSEDRIQHGIEAILGTSFHKKDWGGEGNDLYSSNVLINGVRFASAFMLKGHGLRRVELRIKDCGSNGDQLLRLFHSPAELFVVQYVGQVSEAVIADVQGKVAQLRSAGRQAWFMIIDGPDTARLLFAYGHLR